MFSNRRTFTAAIIAITTIVVIVLVSVPLNRKWSCTTDDNEPGVCVAQASCDSNGNRPSTELVHPTKPSQCGSTNNIVYTCCVEERISKEGTTQLGPTTEPYIHPSIPASDEDIQYGMAILLESECGGDDASLSESPWMALLMYNSTHKDAPHCSGSLITSRYVLTAAHCICEVAVKLVRVRLGGNTGCSGSKCAQSPFQEINIEEAIYHKDYSSRFLTDDIGLIRLVKQAHIDYYVRPICLPMSPESQAVTFGEADLTAWSNDHPFDIDIRVGVVLKTAKVQIMDNDYCQQIFQIIRITENQVCAVGALDGFESGVSGGPLYIHGQRSLVQYGVLSGGEKYGGVFTKSSYSKVTAYLTWIAGNIRS